MFCGYVTTLLRVWLFLSPDVEMMEILVEMQMFTFSVLGAHIVEISASSKDEDPTMPCGLVYLESTPLCMNTATSVAARSPYEADSKKMG